MLASELTVEEIEALLNTGDARLIRASESLREHRGNHLYALLAGIEIPSGIHEISPALGYIRSLDSHLELSELEHATNTVEDAYRIASFSGMLCAELCINKNYFKGREENKIIQLIWLIASLMKIKLEGEFVTVAHCDVPWSSLAVLKALKNKDVTVKILEFVQNPKRMRVLESKFEDVISWVNDNIVTFSQLIDKNKNYQIAVRSLVFDHLQSDLRLKLANLWLGIEALFPEKQELTFKLSLYISVVLEPSGENRYTLFEKVRKLYGERSRAVHGKKISDEDMRRASIETKSILRDLITPFRAW